MNSIEGYKEVSVTVTSPTTIEVSSVDPSDHPRHRIAELLRYPPLDEIRSNQGSTEKLEFEWQAPDIYTSTITPVYNISIVESVGKSVVYGTTGRPGQIGLQVEIGYDGERPVTFRYLGMK